MVAPPFGEGSALAGAVVLVSVVELPVQIEESVPAAWVPVEASGLAGDLLAVLVESVLVGRGIKTVESAVVLEEVESLGAVELSTLELPEFDRTGSLLDVAGLEPEPAVGAEPRVGAAAGAEAGVGLTLPSGSGVELGAAGDAAGGEPMLEPAATGTAGIAGVPWR